MRETTPFMSPETHNPEKTPVQKQEEVIKDLEDLYKEIMYNPEPYNWEATQNHNASLEKTLRDLADKQGISHKDTRGFWGIFKSSFYEGANDPIGAIMSSIQSGWELGAVNKEEQKKKALEIRNQMLEHIDQDITQAKIDLETLKNSEEEKTKLNSR